MVFSMKYQISIILLLSPIFLTFGQADICSAELPFSTDGTVEIDTLTVGHAEGTVPTQVYSRPIAFKTNLLYDIATVVNAAIELPLSRHISLSTDILFPWWLSERHQRALQINAADLEVRYWINPTPNAAFSSNNYNSLTGWFTGLYAGGGLYDLEWDRVGVQGEYFIATGVSGGYATPLSRNINLEFSLGLGYLRTRYREYEATEDAAGEWHLIKQQGGYFNWLGPTKAKISIVWYPHFKKKGNGR